MDANTNSDQRLAAILSDATWACIWAAIATWVAAVVSFAMYWLFRCYAPGYMSHLMGMDAQEMTIIWMAALVLVKVTALSFAVMAIGLWVWKRRTERRLGA
jgi:hypothetical protein